MFDFFSPSGSHTILVYRSYTDTKHRAASLRQQSFLSKWRPSATLDFKNLQFFSRGLCLHDVLVPRTKKIRWNLLFGRWVMVKKRFSRWRPPPSWILEISIFDHVTVIGFNLCCSVPNCIKIGRFFTEIWWFSDLQNGGRSPSWIFMTSLYCIAGHILAVQILSWNFMMIGVVVSEILAISQVGLLAVHYGPWQFSGCACAVSRNP